jgi:hypothetical protein
MASALILLESSHHQMLKGQSGYCQVQCPPYVKKDPVFPAPLDPVSKHNCTGAPARLRRGPQQHTESGEIRNPHCLQAASLEVAQCRGRYCNEPLYVSFETSPFLQCAAQGTSSKSPPGVEFSFFSLTPLLFLPGSRVCTKQCITRALHGTLGTHVTKS